MYFIQSFFFQKQNELKIYISSNIYIRISGIHGGCTRRVYIRVVRGRKFSDFCIISGTCQIFFEYLAYQVGYIQVATGSVFFSKFFFIIFVQIEIIVEWPGV